MNWDAWDRIKGDGHLFPEGVLLLNEQRENGYVTSLVMALRTSESSESFGVKFNEIIGLEFNEPPTIMPESFILIIEDVSTDGWEGVRYSVEDSETEFVSFRCRSINLLSNEAMQPFISFLKLVKIDT